LVNLDVGGHGYVLGVEADVGLKQAASLARGTEFLSFPIRLRDDRTIDLSIDATVDPDRECSFEWPEATSQLQVFVVVGKGGGLRSIRFEQPRGVLAPALLPALRKERS
jgi:hypothetical protein